MVVLPSLRGELYPLLLRPGHPGHTYSRIVIKYLGSKRLLVPVLGEIADGGRRRAPPSTCSPARPGWPRSSSAAGSRSRRPTWRRTARCSATATSPPTPTTVDRAALGRRAGPAQRAAGRAGLRHPHVLRAGALLPAAQRRAHRRDPRRDRARPPRRPAAADPAHRADAGRRPGRLDDRPADGLPQAVVAALAPRPRAAGARRCSPARVTPSAATRCSTVDELRAGRPDVPRPAVQPAPLLHQLPRLGDAGALGRARALRHRLQAGRRPRRRRHAQRVQQQAARCRRRSPT